MDAFLECGPLLAERDEEFKALALSLGILAGTLLGSAIGWRSASAIMTLLTVVLIGLVWARVPDFSGTLSSGRATIKGTLAIPGMKAVLTVTLLFVLAHNILYTDIAPLVVPAELGQQLDSILLLFGVSAITGIFAIGYLISRCCGYGRKPVRDKNRVPARGRLAKGIRLTRSQRSKAFQSTHEAHKPNRLSNERWIL